MFFYFQQQARTILPFISEAKLDYSNLELLPKISGVITRCCMLCGTYGNRENGFVLYERQYTGRLDIEQKERRLKDFEDVDICRQCFADLRPELAKFNQ